MDKKSIVVVGLPESGKTTFLAALWHVISAEEMDSALKFHSLTNGDVKHLNNIAARWREAKIQSRTSNGGMKLVSMNLKDRDGNVAEVTFPDVPGEDYLRMWEERECGIPIAELLSTKNVLLFAHASNIRMASWVSEEMETNRLFNLPPPTEEEFVPWSPACAPTQVQLVEILQLLHQPPLDIGCRKIAIILSAWDTAHAEEEEPLQYLWNKFPLLAQYLRQNTEKWDWSLYGLSAQGGEYNPLDEDKPLEPQAEELKKLIEPGDRIQLRIDGYTTNDITAPLAWLMK